jgi:hypothetical protein
MFFSKYRFPLILLGSLGISVSSYFLLKHFFHKEKKIEEKKEEPYENKYYDKFEDLECIELEEDYVKSLKSNIIIEKTPKGNVLMYYDFEKESFIYYCDTKDISYLYLETIARKYAIQFNCKKIVVDIKKELEEARKEKPKEEIKKKENKNELFASFKDYNRKGSGGSKTMNKKFIIRQNANRYSYRGKFNEYKYLQSDAYKKEKTDDFEILDFASFKRLQEKKKEKK